MYGSIFCCKRAGQKSEALAGFDRRARQDDAVDLLGEQRADGHGHGEIRLSRAARADGEHHVVLFDLFHVAALAGVLGRDSFLAEGTRAAVFEHAAWRFVRLFGGYVHQGLDFGAGELTPMTRQVVVFFDDAHGLIDALLLAFDGQAGIVQMRAHAAARLPASAHFRRDVPKKGSICPEM